MSQLVQAVVRMAQTTFGKCHSEELFHESLSKLRRLAAQLTAQDVNLDKTLANSQSIFHWKTKAPVTFVSVCEDVDFNICIFALRNHSSEIPLHDHPNMHGIIKVISGRVKVDYYTPLPVEGTYKLPREVAQTISEWQQDFLVPSVCNGQVVVDSNDQETCLLTPKERNLHRVTAVDGPAAILDILAPPYDGKDRECHYYSVVATVFDDQLKTDITWLLKSRESPSSFWCDNADYQGPQVVL